VAARELASVQTVGKWRRRLVERGLDEPRPGVPRKIDDARVKSVVSTEFRRSERSIWGPGMCGKSRRMKARE
jgi:transposase